MAIERLKAVSVYSGEHRGPCGFCWFCHGEAQFYGNDKFKNAKYCNALRFLTAKYLYTCANSVTVGNQVTIDVMLNPIMGAAILIFACQTTGLPFNEINEHFLED